MYKLLVQRILGGLSIQALVKTGSAVINSSQEQLIIVLILLPVDMYIMEKHTGQIIYTSSFCIQPLKLNIVSHRRMDGTSGIISVGFRNLTAVTMITLLYRQIQKTAT